MIPRLVLLTDRSQLRLGRGLIRTVAECADAGLAAVVVREHDLEPDHRHSLLAALAGITGLTVLSSRIPDPAADGMHLAAHQAPVEGLWGRSCHSAADVLHAASHGASWVTLSPYDASDSKPGHGPALPSPAFAGHPVPVLALAGIDVGNAAAAVEAGAHGVAVMGAVMRSPDPAATIAGLLREIA